MPAPVVASILKIGLKIVAKSKVSMKGVVGSTKTFAKSASKNAKIKQRLRVEGKRYMKKRRERKIREQEEAQLEQQKQQKKLSKKPVDRLKSTGRSILQRVISVVSLLVIGFIVNRIPKIIEEIKKVIKVIREIVDKIKVFFNSVLGFFKSIVKVSKKLLNTIKSINLGGLKDRIQESLNSFKNVLSDLKERFLGVFESILSFAKKEEQKIVKEKSEEESNNDENSKLKTSVGDTQKVLSAQTNNFNDSLKAMEKESDVKQFYELKNEKETSIKIEGSSSGGSGGGQGNPTNQRGSGQRNRGSGGTSNVKQSEPEIQINDKLNINKPEKNIDTTTITPKRKSKNKIVVVGGNNNSQPPTGRGSSQGSITVQEKNNFLKDIFTISLF
jgi:hypothetical protein